MNKNNLKPFLLILGSLLIMYLFSMNESSVKGGKNKELNESLSSQQELSSDTDLSDDYSYLSDDNDDKQLLELEKQKQKLELENQKIKLKQLEAKNKNIETLEKENQIEKQNEINDNFTKDKEQFHGQGLCNDQKMVAQNQDNYDLLNTSDCNSDYYMLDDTYLSNNKEKIKPNELLPADAVDMKGENFLASSLTTNEQIIGKPTQTNRSRKNYDLRSTPPNPQIEVSPWNMSTMEPDTERRHFEIGTSGNEPAI